MKFEVKRLTRPNALELEQLSRFDHEAFGQTGLRPYDLGLLAYTGAVFCAYVDGEVVGGCQLMRMLDEPSSLWVVGLYIRKPWRSRGLGRRFLEEIIRAAPELGGNSLMLTVDATNEPAVRLYQSVGFRLLDTVPEMYGRGEDRHLMKLDITGGKEADKHDGR